jgi:hypothetical protein
MCKMQRSRLDLSPPIGASPALVPPHTQRLCQKHIRSRILSPRFKRSRGEKLCHSQVFVGLDAQAESPWLQCLHKSRPLGKVALKTTQWGALFLVRLVFTIGLPTRADVRGPIPKADASVIPCLTLSTGDSSMHVLHILYAASLGLKTAMRGKCPDTSFQDICALAS